MTIKIDVTTDLILSLYKRLDNLFPWQRRWYSQRFQRNRNLHKGRQIGADYYFALEAILDACLTGRNKIFIEPAPSEPEYGFISNAAQNAALLLGCKVKSGVQIIKLSNGAELRFLPENNQTWAGLCGDTYVSEWAWFENPRATMEVITAITMRTKWCSTYYSSRCEGDNGAGIVFNDTYYFCDVVPFSRYECGLVHVDKFSAIKGSGAYPDSVINQLYLCQLPQNS